MLGSTLVRRSRPLHAREQLGSAHGAAGLERQLAEARTDTAALIETMDALGRAETSEAAAQAALDSVRRAFGWAYGSYWKVDPRDRALHYVVESGDAGAEFRQVTRISSFVEGVGLAGRAWQRRDLYFTLDLGLMADWLRPQPLSAPG